MGLAVVYNRLFIAVEGQRTQLVRNLFVDGGEKGGAWRKSRWREMMSMREGKERRKEEKAGIRKQHLFDTKENIHLLLQHKEALKSTKINDPDVQI